MYRDANGNFIFRKQNEDGEYIETIDEFTARVYEESEEYRNVLDVCQWIESESQGLIIAKDVSADYSDKSLRFEIQKAALTQGVKYVFYDTLKNDIASIGEWAAFKVTATELEEIAKNLKIFIYGSIQLAENAHEYLPDELNSNNIAESKMIKHVAWTMVLFKEIPKDKFVKYQDKIKSLPIFQNIKLNIAPSTNDFIEERMKETAEIDPLDFLCEHSDEITPEQN